MNIGTIEGLLRLKDEFSQTLRNATRNLADAGEKMQAVGGKISSVGSGITALAAPVAALAAVSVKSAITFESSFTGVRKTLDTSGLSAAQAEAEFAKLSRGLRDLAAGPNAVPVDINELNKIAEAAGQMGIARNDIIAFTRTVADLSQTTNLLADEGATSLAQFQNRFGAIGKDVDRLGSTIVALGNAGASTEKDIIQMGLRIAGAGNQIGLTQGEVLAFANALSSMGIEAEAGGSAISKVMVDMAVAVAKGGRELHNFAQVAGVSTADFQRVFKQDASEAIRLFIEGLGNMKARGEDALVVLTDMGITEVRMRDALVSAAGAGELLKDSLVLQKKAWADNNALQNEAAQRYATTESQIRLVWQRLKDQAITIGQALLPAVLDLLKALSPLVEMFGRWARAFALLPSPARNTIIAVGALAVVIGPLLIVTGQLISAWGSVIALAPKMGAAITLATGPWGLIAAAIVTATAVIVTWIDKWREASEEATRIAVKLGNLEGAARSFYLEIKASGGKVQDTVLSQAWKDADQLARELLKAQKALDDLKAKQSSSSNIDPRLGTPRFDYSRQIKEAEENVNSLSGAYNRMKQGLRSVSEVIKTETEPGLDELLKGILGNIGPVDILTEDMEELGKQLAELRQDLALTARQSLQLAKAYAQLVPPETIAAIKRTHALEAAFLQDVRTFGVDAAESLQLLRAADYDAAQQAAQSEAAWNQYTEAIKRALAALAQAAGNRLFEEMVRNAERQLAKLEQTAAELQRRLRLAGDLRRDVEYEIRISTVDEVTPRLRNIEEAYISFLRDMGEGSVSRGEEIMAAMEQIFGGFIASVRADLATLEDIRIADRVRGSAAAATTGPLQIYRAERAEIVRIMRDSSTKLLKSAQDQADAYAYLDRLLMDSIASYAQGWQQFFSVVGGLFGGFAAKAASVLQQMISTYQATQSAGSAIGGQAGALISSAGPFLAIAGAIVGLQRESAARDRARQYTSSASVGFETGGQYETVGRRGRELANALDAALTPLLDLIDRTAANLPEILVHAREDGRGFAAHINDVFLGYFATLEDAIDAATIAALQQIGPSLSATMRTVLANTLATTSEGLQADLETGVQFDNLGLDDAAIRIQEMFKDFRAMMEDVGRLGLDTGKVKDQLASDLQAFKNEFLGFDTAASQALARLADVVRVLGEQTAQMRAQGEARVAGLQAEMAEAERMIAALRETGGASAEARIGHWERARAEIARQIDLTLEEIAKLPQGLSDMEINMSVFDTLFDIIKENDQLSAKYSKEAAMYARIKVEAEIAALELQLRTLGKWEEFAGMFEDVANFMRDVAGETGKPRRGGGGGRGGGQAGSDRDSARDFVRDRTFELGLRGLTEYQRAVAETTRQYDTLLQQAGKDNQLRGQLIALRQQELDLLAKEQVQSIVGRFREFLGLVSPFDQVRETAAALIKDIETSTMGNPRKAQMIGRILADLDRQLAAMSRQSAVGLFGEMIGDLQALGATEDQMAAARAAMQFLEHTIKMEHYRTEIELLKAQGKLAPEIIRALEESFSIIQQLSEAVGSAVTGTGGGGGGGGGGAGPGQYDWITNPGVFQGYNDANTAIQSVGDSLADMTELLQRYRDQGLSPYQLALRDLNADFARIRTVLGNTAEVSLQYELAVARLRDEYLSSMEDFYEQITTGPMSGLSVESQYAAALANWNQLTNAIATTGDLSLGDEAVEAAQQAEQLAAQLWGTTTGGYQQLLDQLRATMEALGIEGGGASNPTAGVAEAASSLFAGLTPNLLAGVTGALQASVDPFAAQAGAGAGVGALAGAQAQVDATEGVEGAIEVHGARQERLLGELVSGIRELVGLMRAGNNSNADPSRPGWNGNSAGSPPGIMYGDQPTFPQLTRRR